MCDLYPRHRVSPYLFIADQLPEMIKPRHKEPGAREVNLLVLQDSGIIFLLPMWERSPVAPGKRTLQSFSLCLQQDQNRNKELCCIAKLKRIHTNESRVSCISHWQSSALRWKWWSSPRSKRPKAGQLEERKYSPFLSTAVQKFTGK